MLCFSGNGMLSIKASNFPAHQRKQQVLTVPYVTQVLNIPVVQIIISQWLKSFHAIFNLSAGVRGWLQWLKDFLSALLHNVSH